MTESQSKTVSIILPTYNGAQYLQKSIASCLAQTYANIELIIVNDGSTDKTEEILSSFHDQRIIYFKHDANKGVSRALNTGFKNCRGAYLSWTSADNLYKPSAIEEMVKFLEKTGSSFVYSDYYAFSAYDFSNNEHIKLPKEPILKDGNCIGFCFLYTRNVYEKVGEYDTALKLVEDYDYWIRISKHFKLAHLNEALYFARSHRNSLSYNNFYETNIIGYLVRLKHGLINTNEAYKLLYDLFIRYKSRFFEKMSIHKYRFILRINKYAYKIFYSNKFKSTLNAYVDKEIDIEEAKKEFIKTFKVNFSIAPLI